MNLEDRQSVERLLVEMMKEAIKAFHRRLLVVYGEDALDVVAFIVLKHQALRSESNEKWFLCIAKRTVWQRQPMKD